MDTPLQFLRNWLPMGSQPDNTRAADSLREWISTLDDASPQDIAAALSSRLVPLVSEQRNLHMRTRLLDAFEEAAHKVLPALEAEIRTAAVPLTSHIQAVALTADNLLKAQIQGCLTVVSSIEGHKLPAPLLQHVILRAMYALQRRQMLAYHAYATPSASSWQQLHDLHRMARNRALSNISKNSPSIEHVYVAALLLAYAEPGKFPRADLDALRTAADRMSVLVKISDSSDAPGAEPPAHRFLVRTDDGQPGAPFLRAPKASDAKHCLILDCSAVVTALNEEIARRPNADAEVDTEREVILPQLAEPLLHTLLKMWGSQPVRRFSRMRFKPRADLVSGLPDVIQLLAGEALKRRRDDGSEQTESPAPAIPPVSEWAIIDESPDGFGIRYLKGAIRRLEVGELVGLRSREHNRIHLCLVRRASNAGQARFELGLQDLSPNALVVTLPPAGETQARQSNISRKALLLPQLPAYGGVAGIISIPGSLPPAAEFTYNIAAQTVQLRLGRPVELNSRLEFYLLDKIS